MNASTPSRVWLITGCSTGLGRALAREVLKSGDRCLVTARDPRTLEDLVALAPDRAAAVRLDVTNRAEREAALRAALERFGRLDVLVNNAGYGVLGAMEEVSEESERRVFETNVFALFALTRAALPIFRAQRSGHIFQLSSIAGFVSTPGFGIYNATKYAVEGMSEALAGEVGPMGIRVTIVEPGPFRTEFLGRSLDPAAPASAYEATIGATRQYARDMADRQTGDPERAAKAMVAMTRHPDPPLRLVLGKIAVQRMRGKLASVTAELDAWEHVALEADFPE